MSEIIYTKTYREYKQELDQELAKTAEGFVKIGYLLKVARDTNVLAESGYSTVAEFAEAEYNLDKTKVSRFIAINDKFSEGGYSDHLIPDYKGFGYAKLTLMLQLPDAINAELTPQYSKSDIQAIKDEVDKENKVTDIERVLEGTEDTQLIEQIIYNIGKEQPELYLKMSKVMENIYTQEEVQDCMMPQGIATYTTRIRGIGSVMLMLDEDGCKIVKVRTGETEDTDWRKIGQQWAKISGTKIRWEELYGEKFPEKEEVAPVQRKEPKVIKPDEPRIEPEENLAVKNKENVGKEQTLHEVDPSIPKPDPADPQEEEQNAEEQQFDNKEQQFDNKEQQLSEELPGQDSIENHKEWMPGEENEQTDRENEIVKEMLKQVDMMKYHIGNHAWGTLRITIVDLKNLVNEIEEKEENE